MASLGTLGSRKGKCLEGRQAHVPLAQSSWCRGGRLPRPQVRLMRTRRQLAAGTAAYATHLLRCWPPRRAGSRPGPRHGRSPRRQDRPRDVRDVPSETVSPSGPCCVGQHSPQRGYAPWPRCRSHTPGLGSDSGSQTACGPRQPPVRKASCKMYTPIKQINARVYGRCMGHTPVRSAFLQSPQHSQRAHRDEATMLAMQVAEKFVTAK